MELTKPNEALQVASTLQTFVTERKLTANIQGKNYPLVEAWQFAGSQLGLIPVVREVKNLSTDTELKYEAMVEVIRLTDSVVLSRGYAVCSNKENSKRRFDEYAIASMAQSLLETMILQCRLVCSYAKITKAAIRLPKSY